MKGSYYTRKKDGQKVYLLFNELSGFFSEFTVGSGGDYVNPLAKNWGTGNWPKITESHATVLKQDLTKVRKGE